LTVLLLREGRRGVVEEKGGEKKGMGIRAKREGEMIRTPYVHMMICAIL